MLAYQLTTNQGLYGPMGTDLVTHHVEQRAGFSEVIQSLLQVFEGLPLLQGLGQLTDPAEQGGRQV